MDFELFIDHLVIIVDDLISLFDSIPIAGTSLWRLSIGILIFSLIARFMPMFDDDEED